MSLKVYGAVRNLLNYAYDKSSITYISHGLLTYVRSYSAVNTWRYLLLFKRRNRN